MPSPSRRHSTPTKPGSGESPDQSEVSGPVSDTALDLTFGPTSPWKPAQDWALKHQVADALLALAATTLDPEEPRTLGSVLSQVASRSSFDLLEDWASTDDGAQILQRLAGAVEADRSILALCPPWPVEIPARLHFRGALAFRYLAAMTAEQFPPVTPEERRWLATLRLWVLVHGIREAFNGNLVDYYLREVANKIRLACDADRDWRNLIIDLRTSVEDLELLDSRIAMRARLAREALRPDQPGASTKRSFLTALERVARNEAAPVTLPQVGTQGLPALQGSLRRPSTIAIPPRSLVDDEEARGASEQFDSEDEDDDLGSISTDDLPSYTHHRLRTRSVLLARAQTLAHLPWAWEHLNRFEQAELDHWISAALDSADPCLSLLGALTWIAVHTGRSLRRALDIPIAEEPGAEWTLSPTTWGLHREPPRRSGWSPETADQKRWVTPVAPANHLRSRL